MPGRVTHRLPLVPAIALLLSALLALAAVPAEAQGLRERPRGPLGGGRPPADEVIRGEQPTHACTPSTEVGAADLPPLLAPEAPFQPVEGNAPPAIRFSNPLLLTNRDTDRRSTCIAPGFELSVDTADADGEVVRVEYYFAAPGYYYGPLRTFLGESTEPPFTVTWNGPNLRVREGDQGRLVAFAFDDRGAITATSDEIPVDQAAGSRVGQADRTPAVEFDGAAIGGNIVPGTGGVVDPPDGRSFAYDGDSVFLHEAENASAFTFVPTSGPENTQQDFSGPASGRGSIGFANSAGAFLEFPVYVSQAGSRTVTWRYASDRSTPRTVGVAVDGADQATVVLEPTGAVRNWRYLTTTLDLDAGLNLVRLTAVEGGEGGEFDFFTLTAN